jgi:proteasome accessory factor A
MEPILAGIETEYGLYVEGRGAENQIDDSMALVRAFPGKRFLGWDYRHESPRADLRGFRLDRLAFDPQDARFDFRAPQGSDEDIRSDRVLANGARLYNDHGHPEYATPECLSLDELVLHDLAGELVVQRSALAFQEQSGLEVALYKNNTDFHGASYGTHESYLVPRAFGFEGLYAAVMPMLIARQVLCGSGKVGSEAGEPCAFQLSQRADFLAEPASAETLYRRSLFNTRDEPHADPQRWIRLHVIAGDANMIPSATRRKVGLIKLALALMQAEACPTWKIPHPVAAFASVSKDPKGEFRIELGRSSWTNAHEVLESYFSAAERALGIRPGQGDLGTLEAELSGLIAECRTLLEAMRECPERLRHSVDWAAKKWLLEQVMDAEGWGWDNPSLRSYDLEYHNIDPDKGLYFALADEGEVQGRPDPEEVRKRCDRVFEPTRARARGASVSRFGGSLERACWRTLVFREGQETVEIELPPDRAYPVELETAESVVSFIQMLRSLP